MKRYQRLKRRQSPPRPAQNSAQEIVPQVTRQTSEPQEAEDSGKPDRGLCEEDRVRLHGSVLLPRLTMWPIYLRLARRHRLASESGR